MSTRRIFTLLNIACVASLMYSGTAIAHSPYDNRGAYPVIPSARAMYRFVYYPQAQVYYAPQRRVWFWYDGYRWQNNYTLPFQFRVDFRFGGIPINLRSELPYLEHHYVDSYYGRPWRARYYQPKEVYKHSHHAARHWREQEVWREAGRGYPRRDFDRDRYHDQHGHHRW